MTDTATATPVQVDYENLEADVAAWRVVFLDNIRQEYGSTEVDTTAALLEANPWLALQWFVEDSIPAEQRNAAGTPVLQEIVAALEVLGSPEAMLTDSDEMAAVIEKLAESSHDMKGMGHLTNCMAHLVAQEYFYAHAPRDFEQITWDKAQGESFMEGVTREAHAEAFGALLAYMGLGELQ